MIKTISKRKVEGKREIGRQRLRLVDNIQKKKWTGFTLLESMRNKGKKNNQWMNDNI